MKNKVQSFREEKHLTQSELAELSGLSLRTIQRIESGQSPRGFTLKAVANALEIEPENLIPNEEGASFISKVKIINISSLSFIILPFGNIILPAILTYKSNYPNVKNAGKDILSIQIIWTIITCLLMIASPFVQKMFSLHIPLFLIVLLVLYCTNILIILLNGISLNKRNTLYIKLNTSIL